MYDAVGGTETLLRLARAWHARLMADEVVAHAFSHGFHPQHDERLAAYWAEALHDVGLGEEPLHGALHEYFAWATAQLSRYPGSADDVPDGLGVPHWSWDGPQA